MEKNHYFAVVAPGLEELLGSELAGLGAGDIRHTRGGLCFSGTQEAAYRACLWSRLANRILLPLANFRVGSELDLYQGVKSIDWSLHLDPDLTFAVSCTSRKSVIGHSRFAALRVKDGVADWFRETAGRRPDVAPEQPDLQLQLFLDRDEATLYLDLSGESLHRRGYRLQGARAPLKETLAAAILLRSDWSKLAAEGAPLVDPMCGSGTLVIEAALMAGDCAPGIDRKYFGFLGWRQHRPELWQALLKEAAERRDAGRSAIPQLYGFDQDPRSIDSARGNAERAGVLGPVRFKQLALRDLRNPADPEHPGLLLVNPPYGERLGEVEDLGPLYRELGSRWREEFQGWRAALLTGNPELAFELGLRARRYHALNNGPIACRLLHFEISREAEMQPASARPRVSPAALEQAGMLANRLRKNLARLKGWAKSGQIDCFRVYDRDLPEYALAVDLYADQVHVQEYQAPAEIEEKKARQRFAAALEVLPEALGVDPAKVHCKVRQRQRGREQYRKQAEKGIFQVVQEGGLKFLVNLDDYLDTGLFLDHRQTRDWLRRHSAGRSFLNLFAYTGTASVYAAAGGARSTTSVDLSATYLDWARRNLQLNGFDGGQHRLVQADCLEWLRRDQGSYDLIFLDPPTFSNSKRMTQTFDVQRDHVALIRLAVSRLAPGGQLVFSTNQRNFRLDRAELAELAELQFHDLQAETLPRDFARNPKIHQCWLVTRPSDAL